jgi:hypothetical protein
MAVTDELVLVPGRNVTLSKQGSNLQLGTPADPHTTPDWEQTDPSSAAFIKNKPTFVAITNSLFP